MAKMTKVQAKRMVRDIEAKCKKLYFTQKSSRSRTFSTVGIISIQDMDKIEKMCSKWMKRIG
jgi:hypothetical protein